MAGWQLQDLDLRGHGDVLRGLDARGALLLGCTLDPDLEDQLRDRRCAGVPRGPGRAAQPLPRAPLLPRRAVRRARDRGLRQHPRRPGLRLDPEDRCTTCTRMLAQALHDLAVDDALAEWVSGRRLVGVMGGHALARGTDGYADAARLGRALARGRAHRRHRRRPGGDGGRQPRRLPLGPRRRRPRRGARTCSPPCRASSRRWATGPGRRSTYATRCPDGTASLGVPTWFYGHEPPNAFADAGREVLQERDPRGRPAARVHRRHRVPAGSRRAPCRRCSRTPARTTTPPAGAVAPMVLVGRGLLDRGAARCGRCCERLARGREMADTLHLVDDLEEVAGLLARLRP